MDVICYVSAGIKGAGQSHSMEDLIGQKSNFAVERDYLK